MEPLVNITVSVADVNAVLSYDHPILHPYAMGLISSEMKDSIAVPQMRPARQCGGAGNGPAPPYRGECMVLLLLPASATEYRQTT
jgi:hypothetical protein